MNDQSIYLCFSYGEEADSKKCRVGNEPAGSFTEVSESIFPHRRTRIGASQGLFYLYVIASYGISEKLLAIGNYAPSHKEVEIYNIYADEWTSLGEYPLGTVLFLGVCKYQF